jgi:hypothetical protein
MNAPLPPISPDCYLCITARSSCSFMSPVTCACEDAQGQLVVTGHRDGVVTIWNNSMKPITGGGNKKSYSVACLCNAHSQVAAH